MFSNELLEQLISAIIIRTYGEAHFDAKYWIDPDDAGRRSVMAEKAKEIALILQQNV